ncbi:MAG: hypothetical protein NUV51_10930 [Sulfuricaulis sp.]|nr:hypothetical protein [Sulfuricaulis sp.]
MASTGGSDGHDRMGGTYCHGRCGGCPVLVDDPVNPDRLAAFSECYAVAVLQAIVDLNLHIGSRKPQEAALDTTLNLLAMIEAKGLHAVEHYLVNTRGGAFRRTAEQLGIDPSPKALQHYLEG